MERLEPARIRTLLHSPDFVTDIKYFEETDSTNTQGTRLALAGAPEGTVVLAETQQAGRGRRGRNWVSPPGRNLYISIVLRPSAWRGHLGLLTLMGGLAVVDVLQRDYAVSAGLKWPNDVLVGNRKISGILGETVQAGAGGLAAILGIGININMDDTDLSIGLNDRATSVMQELQIRSDRSLFAARLLDRVADRYRRHTTLGPESVVTDWKVYSVTMGVAVRMKVPQGVLQGEVVDLTPDGFLVLREGNGREHTLAAGDVEFL